MNRDLDAASAPDPSTALKGGLKASDELLGVTPRDQGRRRWPRFAVRMPVQVRVTTQGPTRTLSCEGHGSDISCGGLAVQVDIDLSVGSQIAVEFIPPNSDALLAFRGFVRNREGYRYGVEFITENDEDYRRANELQMALEGLTPNVPFS